MLLSPHIVNIPDILFDSKTQKKPQLTPQIKNRPNYVWLFSVQFLKISIL